MPKRVKKKTKAKKVRKVKGTRKTERVKRKSRAVKKTGLKRKAKLIKKGEKYIYFFGNGRTEGGRNLKDLLGGKGSGLAEMSNIGIPVPPGFTLTTQICNIFYKNNMRLPRELHKELKGNISKLEKIV